MTSLDLTQSAWFFSEENSTRRFPASVPGCVHTDLFRNGEIPDPFWGVNELDLQWVGQRNWVYSTEFIPGEALLAQKYIEFVADGLDTLASVYLNDRLILKSDNMFAGHRVDIKPYLRAGTNALRIVFESAEKYVRTARPEHNSAEFNDPVGRSTTLRKQPCQFGWDWGPRFVTAGIWRSTRIEAWSANRIEAIGIRQTHRRRQVSIQLAVTTAKPNKGQAIRTQIFLGKQAVAEAQGDAGRSTLSVRIPDAKLWWPAGQGEQTLYTVRTELIDARDGTVLDAKTQRIGLRTLRLERVADTWGESFRFVVNGRRIFAKGANWIPAHAFVATLTRADYERDLRAAVAANMNMVRVWGGGIYEHEAFYDLCDELGLMVWQDFMFACSLYPYDKAFLESVRVEAAQQVRRLRNRACLALWCGNNELAQLNGEALHEPQTRAGYKKLFHKLLPDVLKKHGGDTDYWPSSEWRGFFDSTFEDGEKRGDTHFWGVWHSRQPVTEYERWHFRFCSEFGMQSYNSLPTQNTFCPPDEANIFGPIMENHQKNRAGNQIIADYISRRYRFPKDQKALIYLSQLNQAFCMRFAIEHYRRISPRCMGALYWQLNDCWPVASWSSIEFTGRWKLLHHAARRFFAPALLSAHVLQDETVTIGNYRKPGDGRIDLYTVYDAPAPQNAVIHWELRLVNPPQKGDDIIESGQKNVRLRHGQSIRQKRLDFSRQIQTHRSESLYLRIYLSAADSGDILSEQTVFLAPPRFLSLKKAKPAVRITQHSQRRFSVQLTSPEFQHAVQIDIEGMIAQFSDNAFDLYPKVAKTIEITTPQATTKARLQQQLHLYSLADTYL